MATTALFCPSAEFDYSAQQLQLIQTMPYIRAKWRVTADTFNGGLLSRTTFAFPQSVQAIAGLMVGPDSDVDRYYVTGKEMQGWVIRPDQEAVYPELVMSLFSVDAPYIGQISKGGAGIPIQLLPAREMPATFLTDTPAPFSTYKGGILLDVIAFLAERPRLQARRPPRSLAFTAGPAAPVSPLFKLAGMPVWGRKRKTVILNNPSAAPINYEVDGMSFSNTTISTVTAITTPLSVGAIPAGSSISIPLHDHDCDALQVKIDIGTNEGIGGQINVFD